MKKLQIICDSEEIFKKYITQGKSILYISGASKVTGTYQSAMMAKEGY